MFRLVTATAARAIDRCIAWHAATRDERALQSGARRLVLSLGHAFELALLAELADSAAATAAASGDRAAARRACLQLQSTAYCFV